MKKSLTLLAVAVVVAIGSATTAHAQTDKQNLVKLNYLSPVVSTLSLFYERAMSDSYSLQLGFFYTGYTVGDTGFSGFGITPEARFYLSDKGAPEGFFLAPFVRYQSFTLTEELSASEGTFTTFGGGFLIGGQWVFKDIISLDVWGGPAYNTGSVEVTSGANTFDTGAFDGFGVRIGSTIGVAF